MRGDCSIRPADDQKNGKLKEYIKKIARILVITVITILLLIVIVRILINQPVLFARTLEPARRADERALRRHVEFLSRTVFPRDYSHPENLDRAAVYIRRTLAAAGARTDYQVFTAGKREYRNVIGTFGPETGGIIVVGAHYDAFGELPGADDNASSVAGLLEIGRLLADKPLRIRTDLVAYSLEEPPYFGSAEMGSAVHAGRLQEKGTRVRAMICLEMIGYFRRDKRWGNWLSGLAYPRHGDFILVAGRWSDRALALRLKRAMAGASDLDVHSYNGPTLGVIDLSDHRNYWAAGYEAVMVTDTAFVRNKNYHTSRDTPDTLNYDRMAEVVDGVVAGIMSLQED